MKKPSAARKPTLKNRANERPQVAAHRLSLSVQWGDELGELQPRPVSAAQLRRWAACTLQSDAQFTLRFVGTTEGRRLNRDFRQKDYATNVLTFPNLPADMQWPPGIPRPPAGADIVICWPVVLKEAQEQHKDPMHHLAHLVIHGCLHGQGYDHETDEQALVMEGLETRLLRRFRISDPYRTDPT